MLWLRLSVATLLFFDALRGWREADRWHLILALAALTACICLAAGLVTPFCSGVGAVHQIVECIRLGAVSWSLSFMMVSVLAAIAILGPGAFSLDAWLFGRKKLTIKRPPG